MSNSVIRNMIQERLSNLKIDNSSIVVLKGIPLSFVDPDNSTISIKAVVDNKLQYFMSLAGKRQYISYEEFLLLADLVVMQYSNIYILNNNIYMEQYPVEECFPANVREGLLAHFSDDIGTEDEDTIIGDIDEYKSLFVGLKEFNGYLIGSYYTKPELLSNLKITNVDLFDMRSSEIVSVKDDEKTECDLVEESDYLNFVKLLFSNPDEIYVRVTNYTGDMNRLKDHISLAAYYWSDYSDIYFVQEKSISDEFVSKPEYKEILKKHWGYDSFRDIKIYDMQELAKGKKSVIEVSQERIISDLVQQVENCEEKKNSRDVFVTAPTGAGKSVMFQIPAIYLAQQYKLLTIVISPLIGLMTDQVKNLELKNYNYAKTINSDLSPILKQEIINDIAEERCHILYISPETLLSRSVVEQLIGERQIGMIVIDEAHIVTTWGKQFRPDYWYLGDYIKKLRSRHQSKFNRSFIVATFTATAIYHGFEDMYTETINSLHMLNPITYLGYVKRGDINIVIDRTKKDKNLRSEYEFDKFLEIEDVIKRATYTNKKTLIYFPTVALIDRCYEFLRSKREADNVTIYHGQLSKDKKLENYNAFCDKSKLVMLATKAFGMGIDIDDIELLVHFAPTGNVCDYVQEVGRAARRPTLTGEAYYHYNSRDFKHINRLHGLSSIQKYQLVKVIEKIDDLYQKNMQGGRKQDLTRKRNSMLLDAENFAYIFGTPLSDEDNNINKVKTALLLIQKDFESRIGFSPIVVRPIPMFSIGFFEILPKTQKSLLAKYPDILEEIDSQYHICRVHLDKIWNKDYRNLSFPKFKFMLYEKDEELELVRKYPMTAALCVNISFERDYKSAFTNSWDAFKGIVYSKIRKGGYTDLSEIVQELGSACNFNKYRSLNICEVIIASMSVYRKSFAKTSAPIAFERVTGKGITEYQFNVAVNSFFDWVEKGFNRISSETKDGVLYLINNKGNVSKEYSTILGILESLGCLSFEMLGGANSQLYIYINQILSLKNIVNRSNLYNNRLLEKVAERHLVSVKMLTYIYENDFDNDAIWNLLEEYFLGSIPDKVKSDCRKEKPDIIFD